MQRGGLQLIKFHNGNNSSYIEEQQQQKYRKMEPCGKQESANRSFLLPLWHCLESDVGFLLLFCVPQGSPVWSQRRKVPTIYLPFVCAVEKTQALWVSLLPSIK